MAGVAPVRTVVLALLVTGTLAAVDVYVRDGADKQSADGSSLHPFPVISMARDKLRELSLADRAGSVVHIGGGTYDNFGDTVLELTADDSGMDGAPVTYQPWDAAPVRLSGGLAIPPSAFHPSSSLPGVWMANLSGIQDLTTVVQTPCSTARTEVFYNGEPMNLARWPNLASNGTWVWAHATGPAPSGCTDSACVGFSFDPSELGGIPASHWVDEPNAWLHGYWEYDWRDTYVKIGAVTENNVTMADGRTPVKPGGRWYVVNALSELDSPGEYYISANGTDAGTLYFMPPTGNLTTDVYVSVADHAVTVDQASHIVLNNIDVAFTRLTAISAQDTVGFRVQGGLVSNTGSNGIDIFNGTRSGVSGTEVTAVACKGIAITGGDHRSLTRSDNSVESCNIHHYARWSRTYMPGIFWAGVGAVFSANRISWGPHNAILGGANEAVCDPSRNGTGPCGGNENLFVGNSIADVAFECSDTGAFYSCGQDGTAWITRGNAVINNTFTRIRMTEPTRLGYPSVQAIYLDDQNSGWTISGNTFVDCQIGMFIGGGRDNLVLDNNFEHCDTAVHVDNRGMNWQKTTCAPGDPNYVQAQTEMAYPAWAKYNISLVDPCVPVNNTIANNVYCECDKLTDASSTDITAWHDATVNNTEVSGC